MKTSHRTSSILRVGAGAALLVLATPVLSQTAPDLGLTASYAIVSQTLTNTTPGSVVTGDVCFTTGPAVVPTIIGTPQTPCDPQLGLDQGAARADLVSQSCTPIGAAVALNDIVIGGGLPGVFPPGCYSSTGDMTITTGETLTLTGYGVHIFRPGGALDPAADSSVVALEGACADNVFWTPEGATTLGANATFLGTVFRGVADGLSITLGGSASLEGRALAFGSTVTMDNNVISVPDQCPLPGTLIVEKQTNPRGSLQSFDFTGDAVGSLSDGQQIVVGDLVPGNYSASEIVPAGWELTDIVCSDTESSGDTGTATANFVLDAGETVTCVFINAELTSTDGTITIRKQASPAATGALFDFSGDLGSFSLTHGQFVVETLPPGIYAVSEMVPDDWLLTSATCSNGSPVSAIDVAARENVTCTFFNTLRIEPINVPIFAAGGLALLALLMMAVAAVFPRYFASVRAL